MPKFLTDNYNVIFYESSFANMSVGQISRGQLDKLLNSLYSAKTDISPCVSRDVRIELNCAYKFPTDEKGGKMLQGQTVYVYGLLGRANGSPCGQVSKYMHDPFMTCAKNFKSGKCKCPYMTNVFGAIILPELYGKQK